MLKRGPCPHGLGDRFGALIMGALFGEFQNKDVYSAWVYDSVRGSQLPNNILHYIKFPKRLKLVDKEKYDKLDNIEAVTFKWIYYGFDYIPETMYRSLYENNNINCSYDKMLNIYKKIASEFKYKKELPEIYKERPGIIHIRLGDKGIVNHDSQIINIVNTLKSKVNKWIITSDGKISDNLKKNINNIVYPDWSLDLKVRTLEEFFMYSHSSYIIQCVGQPGSYGGWSSFSYLPFLMGQSIYPDSPPVLISTRNNNEGTRLTSATQYASRKLNNVYMYDELNILKEKLNIKNEENSNVEKFDILNITNISLI